MLGPEISKVRCDQMNLLCDANACVAARLNPESLSSSQDQVPNQKVFATYYVRQLDHPPPNSASACALACRMDLLMIASAR